MYTKEQLKNAGRLACAYKLAHTPHFQIVGPHKEAAADELAQVDDWTDHAPKAVDADFLQYLDDLDFDEKRKLFRAALEELDPL